MHHISKSSELTAQYETLVGSSSAKEILLALLTKDYEEEDPN